MPRIAAATVAEHNVLRRRQVVDAAVDVLAERGVAGLLPAEVAKRAGLARSSIYQYYPSTEALLGAAVESMLVRTRDRVMAAVSGDGSPAERVAAYVRAAVEDAGSGHGTLPDLNGLQMPDHCRAAIRRLHDELVDPLRRALAEAGVAEPEAVGGLVQGVVAAAVTAIEHGAPAEPTVGTAVDFVLRGTGLAHDGAGR